MFNWTIGDAQQISTFIVELIIIFFPLNFRSNWFVLDTFLVCLKGPKYYQG